MSKPNDNCREFVVAYFECALWSSTDDDGESLGDSYDTDDIGPDSKRDHMRQCVDFINANATDLGAVGTWEQHGHDFWLTRNGHGAGFWDRGYGKRGDRLTAAAELSGSCDPYVGDDGKVYIS